MIRKLVVLLALLPGVAVAQSSLPDPDRTPGAVNPNVTQATIQQTICVRGWTQTIRPRESYTNAIKRRQIREFGYRDRRLSSYAEDHLIPLELGGAPADPDNLWPEPRHPTDGWTDKVKDELEYRLNRLVCSLRLPLVTAQRAIATNWEAAYNKFVLGE